MCCGNRRRHNGLIATGVILAAQKYDERKQQKALQEQAVRAQPLQAPFIPVEHTVPEGNPPPYEDDEKGLYSSKDVKYVDDGKVVRTETAGTDRSFYYADGDFHYADGELNKDAVNGLVEPPMEAQSSGSAFAQWKERRRAAKALGGCCGKKTTC